MRTALSLSNVSPPHVCWGFSGCASYTLLAALHCICGSSDVQVYHPLGKVSVTSVCWQVCQKHATCCGFRHFCGICQRNRKTGNHDGRGLHSMWELCFYPPFSFSFHCSLGQSRNPNSWRYNTKGSFPRVCTWWVWSEIELLLKSAAEPAAWSFNHQDAPSAYFFISCMLWGTLTRLWQSQYERNFEVWILLQPVWA